MNDSTAADGRRPRRAIKIFGYLLGALVVASPFLICAGVDVARDRIRSVSDPDRRFTQRTGLAWPSPASIVSAGDDHGTALLNSNGEFHLIFTTDRKTLAKWLQNPPPWNQPEWKSGPVPTEIGYHCAFGTSGVSVSIEDGGPRKYFGEPTLERVLGTDKIWYVANERCCQSLPWRKGDLLVIDLENNQVWLSSWDF